MAGILARFVVLDSDPRYRPWSGHLVDEGRWTEQARSLVLFGELSLESTLARIHLLLAPLFQASSAGMFALFGVGTATARILGAASGGLIIVITLFMLRRRVSGPALLVSLLILAFQPDLLSLSRVAIPEVPSLLFELLAFMVLVSTPRSARRALIGGLLFAVAVGIKGTLVLVAPVFACVIWVASAPEDPVGPARRLVAFAAGLCAPALLVLGASLLVEGSGTWSRLGGVAPSVLALLGPASAYGMVANMLYGALAGELAALYLPMWMVACLLLSLGRVQGRCRELYLGSAAWAVGYLLLGCLLMYFPGRYRVHGFVPIAINLAAGLTLLREAGWQEIRESLEALPPLRRAALAGSLALPLAVLLASPGVATAGALGITLERLTHHVPLVVALLLALAALASRFWRLPSVPASLIALPFLVLAVQGSAVAAGVPHAGHWSPGGVSGISSWAGFMLVAVMANWLLMRRVGPIKAVQAAALAYAIVLASTWVVALGAKVVAPSYTIVSAGRALPEVIPEGSEIATLGAASLFLENDLRYRDGVDHQAQYLVVAFANAEDVLRHTDHFPERVRSFDLNLGENHAALVANWNEITVFRRAP